MKKVVKKTIKKAVKKTKKVKDDLLFVAGLITKGKDKGKYVAVQVRNTMLLNPIEPIFETNPDMEYVVVSKNEEALRTIFGRIVAMASQDGMIKVKKAVKR
jgi:hypothetical protein